MGRVIQKLFELRDLPAPRVADCLLGEKVATIPFVDDVSLPGSSISVEQAGDASYPVPMMMLDDCVKQFLPEGLTFIKCDAEGWDAKILMSGPESLARYKPKIAVTTYHNPEDYRVIAKFLTSIGYQCHGKGLLYFPHHQEYRTLMLHAIWPITA